MDASCKLMKLVKGTVQLAIGGLTMQVDPVLALTVQITFRSMKTSSAHPNCITLYSPLKQNFCSIFVDNLLEFPAGGGGGDQRLWLHPQGISPSGSY
jgi:hypothetical protein